MSAPATNWRTLQDQLAATGYVAADDLTMALHLSLMLGRPLLLEGAAGVGKTQIARTLATLKDTRLIRLQCYEGLDVSSAVYEWNYAAQMIDNQTFRSFETIVVDNASTDGSIDRIVEQAPNTTILRESVNHGFAAGNK